MPMFNTSKPTPTCDEGFKPACYQIKGENEITVTINGEPIKLTKNGNGWVPAVPAEAQGDAPAKAADADAAEGAPGDAPGDEDADERTPTERDDTVNPMQPGSGGARRKRRSNKRKPKKSAKKPKRSKKGKTRKQKK